MDAKDISLFAAVAVTFLLGIVNLVCNIRQSRKTAFINTVTSERVKWINNIRENISKFVGLNHHWFVLKRDIDEDKIDEITRDLRVLRYYIKLQLNPRHEATIDRAIMEIVDEISDKAPTYNVEELHEKLNALISTAQELLKAEWDKVKREAQRGALADKPTLWRLMLGDN
jgi:hypothetical protein